MRLRLDCVGVRFEFEVGIEIGVGVFQFAILNSLSVCTYSL